MRNKNSTGSTSFVMPEDPGQPTAFRCWGRDVLARRVPA